MRFGPNNHPGLVSTLEEKAKCYHKAKHPHAETIFPLPQGETFDIRLDYERLNKQQKRVLAVLKTGKRFTPVQLGIEANCPESSATRRFREIRSMGYPCQSKRVSGGTWIYWMEES